MVKVILYLSLFLFLYSCSNDVMQNEEKYQVEFYSTWSEDTHPYNFPTNPHYSGLIGAIHNESINFWKLGNIATPAIESMAETGSKTLLLEEINNSISNSTSYSVISEAGLTTSPDSNSFTIDVSIDYPKVTLVSMIAPSPDWFVGVNGILLLKDGDWVERLNIPLYALDAGTDSGSDYISPDSDTLPREVIKIIEGQYVEYNGNTIPFGTLLITKID